MTDTTQNQATIITIVLPAEGQDNPASIAVKQGNLGHVSTFAYDDFATICRALNTGLGGFNAVKANPPGDVESAQKTIKASKKDKPKPKKKDKPAGKPPYHLLNASGARRELMTMTDPFDVTEKCMKNKKMVFKELADAEEIAQMLVDAGETRITIVFKNGKTAKVIGETPSETSSDDTSTSDPSEVDTTDASADDVMVYPDHIDNETTQALYDHLQDVDLTLAIAEEVGKTKKHDWTNNLIKQREVKGAISKHVDEDKVEAIYEIFFDIEHVASASETDPTDADVAEGEEKQTALI